jgi:hypothetical protein
VISDCVAIKRVSTDVSGPTSHLSLIGSVSHEEPRRGRQEATTSLHTGALSGPNQGLCIRVIRRLRGVSFSESPAATCDAFGGAL